MDSSSIDIAIVSLDRAINRIAERLKNELNDISYQLDEVSAMMTYNEATGANREAFRRLKKKFDAIDPLFKRNSVMSDPDRKPI